MLYILLLQHNVAKPVGFDCQELLQPTCAHLVRHCSSSIHVSALQYTALMPPKTSAKTLHGWSWNKHGSKFEAITLGSDGLGLVSVRGGLCVY